MPQGALGLLSQPCQHGIPDAAAAPPAELGIDRAPWSEARGEVASRATGAQDMEETLQMEHYHMRPSSASSRPIFQQQSMNEEALSRRATSRLRVNLLNIVSKERRPSRKPVRNLPDLRRHRLNKTGLKDRDPSGQPVAGAGDACRIQLGAVIRPLSSR